MNIKIKRVTHFALTLLITVWGVVSYAQPTPEEIERQTVEVNTLLDQADLSTSISDKEKLATQALSIARSIQFEGGQLRALISLAETQEARNNTEAAVQYYIEAEAKMLDLQNEELFAGIKKSLGDLFFSENLYGNARKYYREALSQDPENYEIISLIADTYLLQMRYDSAEYLYKTVEKHYNEVGDYAGRVRVLQKLADGYTQIGNFGKGLYIYLDIQNIIEKYGSPIEKATLYNNLGLLNVQMNDYNNALSNFKKAELQCQFANCDHLEVLHVNMGIALHNTGNTIAGIENLQIARKIYGQKDYSGVARVEQLMADMYFKTNDLYNALQHNQTAIRLAQEYKQTQVLLDSYETAADLNQELYDYEKAFYYYKKYLNLLDSVRLTEQARQQRLTQQQAMLAEKEGAIKLLLAQQNLKKEELEAYNLRLQTEKDRLLLESRQDSLIILQKENDYDEARFREQALQVLQQRQQLRLRDLEADKQSQTIQFLKQQDEAKRAQDQADSLARAKELENFRKDQQLKESRIAQQQSLQRFLMGLGLLLLLILALLGVGWWLARQAGQRLKQQNQQIQAQSTQIAEERHKSDRLLRNILPEEIAHELKTRGYANPRFYDLATVVFTDFTDFTKLSEQLTPNELIDELDECFLAFDEISEQYNMEKIKTIGDAYMCAGGLPIPNESHAIDAVKAALEMVAWLDHRARTNPKSIFNAMRIGIHTGPVVAGVVGKNKFAYDIWGDAVNLASRLEEQGEPGRINISGATHEAIKHRYRCTFRGKREVHNKGMVDMYFVDHPI